MGCLRLEYIEKSSKLEVVHRKNSGASKKLRRVFQPWQSPYNSMDGNPINLNDPSGLKPGGSGDLKTVKYNDKDYKLRRATSKEKEELHKRNDWYESEELNGKNILVDKKGDLIAVQTSDGTIYVEDPKETAVKSKKTSEIKLKKVVTEDSETLEDKTVDEKEDEKEEKEEIEEEEKEITFSKTNIKINVSFDANEDEIDSPTSNDWGSDDISEDILPSLKILRMNKNNYIEIWPSTAYRSPSSKTSGDFKTAKDLVIARGNEVKRQFLEIEPSLDASQVRIIIDGSNYGSAIEFRSITWQSNTDD